MRKVVYLILTFTGYCAKRFMEVCSASAWSLVLHPRVTDELVKHHTLVVTDSLLLKIGLNLIVKLFHPVAALRVLSLRSKIDDPNYTAIVWKLSLFLYFHKYPIKYLGG